MLMNPSSSPNPATPHSSGFSTASSARNQRAHCLFGLVAELSEIGFELVAVIADQPFHAAGVDDDRRAAASWENAPA